MLTSSRRVFACELLVHLSTLTVTPRSFHGCQNTPPMSVPTLFGVTVLLDSGMLDDARTLHDIVRSPGGLVYVRADVVTAKSRICCKNVPAFVDLDQCTYRSRRVGTIMV